jgi:hypothetical protein
MSYEPIRVGNLSVGVATLTWRCMVRAFGITSVTIARARDGTIRVSSKTRSLRIASHDRTMVNVRERPGTSQGVRGLATP